MRRILLVVGGLVVLLTACAGAASGGDVTDVAGPASADTAATAGAMPAAEPAAPNPMAGATFFVDPRSSARKQAAAWAESRPADARQLEKIAGRSQADWFNGWSPDVRRSVDERTTQIEAAGALPVYVIYNIPLRDCGWYSAGGAADGAAYRAWVRAFAAGLAGRPAVVILEPDALAGMDCLSAEDADERLALLKDAVRVLTASGDVAVYLDAGNPRWMPPEQIAGRLRAAGVEEARGFALNVSNFYATAESVEYGAAVSRLIGGGRFVVDTSRNGLGPKSADAWCNPDGRALGTPPTADTGHPLADAFLWVKSPGESDGTCNGGPAAGVWWPDYALGLAQRSD